jgi:hypothetical protein
VAQVTLLPYFTPAEQSRLMVYKVAVAAGLYSDTSLEPPLAHRFTAEELARLMVYKAAIAAGLYTDDIREDDRET